MPGRSMKSYTRPVLIILSLVALGASVAALYVHYRLLSDPTYVSFCDVSATVSCESVLQSQYGTVAGVPVAAGGAIWSALVLMLAAVGMRQSKSEAASRVAGYVFVLATIGLAAVFYYAYTSFIVLKQMCPLCTAMYVAVLGIFIVAAGAAGSLASLPSRLGQDVEAVGKNGTAAALAGAWVVASIALILLFPREQVLTAEGAPGASEAPQPVVVETLTPDQMAEWKQWIDAQPRIEGANPTGEVKVLVMKFNDYQCPACRATYGLYRDIFAKWEAKHPGVFRFETRDFPLESECGAGGNHSAACEEAVAIRLAREKGRDKQLEAMLFDRQSFSLTRGDVIDMLEEVAQVPESEFNSRYASLIETIRADSQLGTKLGVTGTPTFFLNGIRMPSVTLRPAHFDAAIAYELEKAGVMP
jgi:uncharacterized membrane protein/protein-disulfide isomerase